LGLRRARGFGSSEELRACSCISITFRLLRFLCVFGYQMSTYRSESPSLASENRPRRSIIACDKLSVLVDAYCNQGLRNGGNRSDLIGYRSNRSGPISVWAGIKPAPIQNSNLNSKKIKIPKPVIPTGKPVKPAGKPVYRPQFKIQI